MVQANKHSTLALSTKVEEDFVGPLTALRGALEILRDYPDLNERKRNGFVSNALRSCHQLEAAVNDLADAVYAAGQTDEVLSQYCEPAGKDQSDLFVVHDDTGIMEIEFSGLVFKNSKSVNDVFDAIEERVHQSGQRWYFIINMEDCSIWPEAWVAFAHRGKKLKVKSSHGIVRYQSADAGTTVPGSANEDLVASREAAMARIEEMRSAHTN